MRRRIFTAEHDLLRAQAQGFVRDHVEPSLAAFAKAGELSREFWREAGRRGFLGVRVPDEWGGQGSADFPRCAVIGEELAAASAAVAASFTIHAVVCASYLVELATPECKRHWLPALCAGELVAAIAITEPGAGSDVAGVQTTAVRDGDAWILNGTKMFITNGSSADLVIVAARTNQESGARGLTLFGVAASSPGFTRERRLETLGQAESGTAELSLRNVRVPDVCRLGEVDAGFGYLMRFLIAERVIAGLNGLAHAAGILDETITYVHQRVAFGQPIGSFQHTRFTIAEMVTALDVARAFADSCLTEYAAGQLSAVDAAKLKWWAAHTQNDVIDRCLQLHGGHGYLSESRVARAWRDARVTKIWAGSNEIMKEIIGRDMN
ncbi:MAG: acyl-CoA dehydrogenase family protein [Actinomycetota bacterium]